MPAKTTRQKPAPLGRPTLTKRETKLRDAVREADGRRLSEAMQLLQLSQADVGRITGIGQNHVNEIVNGTRSLVREDLRNLAKVGISAEYVLGLTETHISPGHSRSKGQLDAELDTYFETEITKRFPTNDLKVEEPRQWKISGSMALAFCIEHLSAQAREEIADLERAEEALRRAKALVTLAGELGAAVTPNSHSSVAQLDADARQLKKVRELLDIAEAITRGIGHGRGRGLVLARTIDVNDPTFFERMGVKSRPSNTSAKTAKPTRRKS